MPTLPSEPARTPDAADAIASAALRDDTASAQPEPHRARQIAESFGVDPERYDRARPGYPAALIERIVDTSPGREVLDVGCGTGVAARQLQAAGCVVLGVEPDARMAEFARGRGTDVEVAKFEDWDAAGRQFDAVVAGTAWHWVDPVAGAAQARRVLRPGGRLVVFWHVARQPVAVATAFASAYQRAVPDSPFDAMEMARRDPLDIYQAGLDKAADGMRTAGGFGVPEQWRDDWEKRYSTGEYLDLLATQGTLTPVPRERVREVLDEVGAAIDALGGSFTMPYATIAVSAGREA